MKLVILPHHLFERKHLPVKTDTKIVIWEHPHYFKKFKYNKKKLVLHRASMKYYYTYLKDKGFKHVTYINFNKKIHGSVTNDDIAMFDPIDDISLLPFKNVCFIENPNFLIKTKLMQKYRNKTDKFRFYNFYMFMKKELGIIPRAKSTDKQNREKIPEECIDYIPEIKEKRNNKELKYIKSAVTYVNKNFKNNYGNTKNFIFPVTHRTAKLWLKDFIKHKLDYFGVYQDAIVKDENYLFHSLLSSSINIGLLNPDEIIQELLKVKGVPMNSLEGLIRQYFWREYQRYTYTYLDFDKLNYFRNKKKLGKKWYNGTLGIDPVDDCIIKGFDTGYLHHIERLMVVGNFMNLSRIHPKEGLKWFMEFSCDSYLWVMYQNVLDMVFFVTGGQTMRKPYISSSGYILKMSNYKKDEWTEKWDKVYNSFLKSNKSKLKKFRYHFPHLFKK